MVMISGVERKREVALFTWSNNEELWCDGGVMEEM